MFEWLKAEHEAVMKRMVDLIDNDNMREADFLMEYLRMIEAKIDIVSKVEYIEENLSDYLEEYK